MELPNKIYIAEKQDPNFFKWTEKRKNPTDTEYAKLELLNLAFKGGIELMENDLEHITRIIDSME